MYDASIGRFLTTDPIEDGRNWHTYAGNNPQQVDPTGLQGGATSIHHTLRVLGVSTQAYNWGKDPDSYRNKWKDSDGSDKMGGPYKSRRTGRMTTSALYKDCAVFVKSCDPYLSQTDEGVMGLVRFLHDQNVDKHGKKTANNNGGMYKRITNNDKYKPEPGDIWILPGEGPAGHVRIVGSDGAPVDASLGGRGPEPGDPSDRPGSNYEIWRPTN